MKNEKWIVWLVIGFTSLTTFMLLADGTIYGFIRAAGASTVLDGLIIYWDEKRVSLRDERQRRYANNMTWAGVGMVFLLAFAWAVENYAPVDALKTYPILGYEVILTLHDFILMLAQGMIGAWVVLTLGVIMYLRQIDPEIKRDLEYTKALEEREKEHSRAFNSAMRGVSRIMGTDDAMQSARQHFEKAGYTEVKINELLARAEQEIKQDRGETVDAPMRGYAADAVNFTKPSTPK